MIRGKKSAARSTKPAASRAVLPTTRAPRDASAAPPRRRGRPAGRTPQGDATRRALYDTALKLFTRHGYEATTLRQIAAHADVSVGLLYRYFPSKRAVVLNLYDRLSLQFEMDARAIEPGPWRQRFVAHMRASLAVLAPHRAVLSALVPILVDGHDEGLFSPTTAMSRDRVQSAFVVAVVGATDTPPRADAEALGRSLYLVHLAVVLWWLLDRSPQQRATKKLVALIGGALPMGALALRLPPVRALVRNLDALIADALMPPTAPKAGASDA